MNEARSLLRQEAHGVLATISLDLPGYPFGSLTPYSLDQQGNPIILVSDIAQHTKNIQADSRVSLTVVENGDQNSGRLTFVADATRVEDDLVAESYFKHYPSARHYGEAHSFGFYRLELKRARYIAGFGKIFWVEPDEFLQTNPFWGEAEKRVVDHMNADHANALVKYCTKYKELSIADEDQLSMTGIDAEGFDLLLNKMKLRFEFEEEISTSDEARAVLVAMAA
ncbi:MAG: HugZ family protein [Candidatus Melainabacteria bacterium]|jgi:heme iron utilization protein|nr:HugZ family protein [Candidatus Melainabacteria bacterium]